MEAGFAVAGDGLPEQIDLYQRTASSLRTLLESIGLERRSRTVVPSVAEYLTHVASQEKAGAACEAYSHPPQGTGRSEAARQRARGSVVWEAWRVLLIAAITGGSPALRHRPRRVGSVWLAQEAEGSGLSARRPFTGRPLSPRRCMSPPLAVHCDAC